MNLHHASRLAVVTLISLLPFGVYAAEPPPMSDVDLESASERIRQTGAEIRETLKEARARHQAKKAAEEAERKREAERARAEQAAIREAQKRQAQEAAEAQARRETALKAEQAARERQAALDAQRQKEAQLARERAARALADARASVGPRGMGD